jgi:hypothetical protein
VVARAAVFRGLAVVRYAGDVASVINLADPTFEPSGEQLQALAARAFTGVREANERGLERMRAEITRQREMVLRSLGEVRPDAPRRADTIREARAPRDRRPERRRKD